VKEDELINVKIKVGCKKRMIGSKKNFNIKELSKILSNKG
jgi:hypothetical protein